MPANPQRPPARAAPTLAWLAYATVTCYGVLVLWGYFSRWLAVGYMGVMSAALVIALRRHPPTTGLPGRVWRVGQEIARRRRWIASLLSVAAAWQMLGAAVMFSLGGTSGLSQAVVRALLGGVLLLTGQALTPPAQPPARRPVWRTSHTYRLRWGALVGGLLLLAITLEINGDVLEVPWLKGVPVYPQLALLVSGVGLVGVGLAGRVRLPGAASLDTAPRRRPSHTTTLALAAVVIGAVAVRAWQLDTATRFFIDEIHFTNPIRHFYYSNTIELLLPFSSVAAFPYLYPFLQWNAVEVFGRTLVGLRATSVLFGAAGVGAVYLLGREIGGRRLGLVAAALLAAYPPHVHFSRIGLNNIADPFFGTLALYFLLRALRRPAHLQAHFAWAGVLLGLTQYFYEGGRLLYAPLAAGWLLLAALLGGAAVGLGWLAAQLTGQHHLAEARLASVAQIDLRRWLQGTLVLAVACAVVSLPIYTTLIAKDRRITQRLETAGLRENITAAFDDPAQVAVHVQSRVWESFLLHVSRHEGGLYYGGRTALVLGSMLPFFLAGLVAAARQMFTPLRTPGAALLLLWLALTWLGNALLQESDVSARYVVAFPAVIVLIALGVCTLAEALLPGRERWQNRVMAACVAALIILQLHYYFGPHLAFYNVQFRSVPTRGRDVDDVLFRAAEFPANTLVHIIDTPVFSERDANDFITYLTEGVTIHTLAPDALTEVYLRALPVNLNHAFFVAPGDRASIQQIQQVFPAVVGPTRSPYMLPPGKEMVLYYIARSVMIGR